MTEPWAAQPALSEALQAVTERLAAAHHEADVLRLVLDAAQYAVGALGGALLREVHKGALRLALAQGDAAGAHSLWQDGARTDPTPIHDALNAGQPLFFEHAGALNAAYPKLEAHTGGVAAVATAVLPLMLDDQALGVLVLDFREPHPFTPEEQRFLRTLTVQAAIALDRVALLDRLDQRVRARTATLDAFVTYSEAVGRETELLPLAQRAVDTLRAHFPGCAGGYYGKVGDRWVLQTLTRGASVDPAYVAHLQAGLGSDLPSIALLLASREPTFVEHWDPDAQGMAHSGAYSAAAAYPIVVGGAVQGFFAITLVGQSDWPEQDRAIFRAVGRGLDLALERAGHAERLQQRNAELDARTQALLSFAALTRDLVMETDQRRLMRRTQEVVLKLLPPGFSLYFEPEGAVWRVVSQVGHANTPELQAALDAGLPFEDTTNLIMPFRSGEAHYQNESGPDADGVAGRAVSVYPGTSVTLPVVVNGETRGVLGFALYTVRPWSRADRAVLETVGGQLTLALERAEALGQRQRAADALQVSHEALRTHALALEQANEELEAFNYSVSHDLMTPVRHIASFTQLAQQHLAADPHALRYLDVIERAGGRMRELIDAMLQMSRLGRRELRMGTVDLEVLVRQAQADLEPDLAGRDVTWRIAALPSVLGDRSTLQQAVTNLLSNAVKYTRTRPHAVIEVWAQDNAHMWRVFVRDNGVGFDPHYTSKLFGIFQRLHRAQDFEGTGVGLANVRRIVARHGGTVFAEGRLGEGATFGFTLPKRA